MGHNKKQQRREHMDDVAQGDGKCSFCGKTVQSLRDHIMDQHKNEI